MTSSSQSLWKAKGFRVIVGNGKNLDNPRWVEVAGWVSGDWALDFRVYEDAADEAALPGWCLTHIPTGRVAGLILANLATAQGIAAEMASAGDWSEVTPDGGVPMAIKLAAHKVRERHDDSLLFRSPTLGPLFWEARAQEQSA